MLKNSQFQPEFPTKTTLSDRLGFFVDNIKEENVEKNRKDFFELIENYNYQLNNCLSLKIERDLLLSKIFRLKGFESVQFSAFIFLLNLDQEIMVLFTNLYGFQLHLYTLKNLLKNFCKLK